MQKTKTEKHLIVLIAACILSVTAMTLYSHSSPFYLMNPWEDVCGNLTIGKSMLNGIVLYRDIFEQRGPLLYFLHAFAWLISPNNYHGIWILEALASAAFVYFAYRILALYEKQSNIVFLPLVMILIYSSRSYGLGGSPEEFCMPLLTASLYILLKALKNERMLTIGEYVWIGILSGAVLWIKFSMLGFYIGSVLPVLVLVFWGEGIKGFLRLILGVVLGVAVISIPVFAYFLLNNALESLFRVYFYINLNYYPFNDSVVYKLYFAALGLLDAIRKNWQYWILIVIGLVQLFRIEKRPAVLAELLFGAAGLSIVIYSGGQQYPYYALILSIYAIFALLVIPEMKSAAKTAVTAVAAICIAIFGWPKYQDRINTGKEDYVQFRFAEKMEKGSTLLNYQFLDGGFFYAADILPSQYYAWSFNVLNEEIREEQNRYVAEGQTDYIVSRDRDVEEADVNHQYELIEESEGCYLYQRMR